MPLLAETVGHRTQEFVTQSRWQDCVLHALGVGAKANELPFLYEELGPRVLPSYALLPSYEAIRALFEVVGGNYLGVVHSAQKLRLHRPLPANGELRTVGEVKGLYDLKRMAQAVFHTETRDAQGELLAETEWSMLYRFDGGFGGSPPPRTERVKVPERAPDFQVEEKTQAEQALLYRLGGDHNPLHADPEIGKKAGFDGPILHGLCTYGYLGRALLHSCCDGDPARLKSLSAQFRKPVFPGDTLISEGWREGARVLLRVRVAERPDDAVLSNSVAEIAQ